MVNNPNIITVCVYCVLISIILIQQINRVMLEQSIDVLSVLAASVDGQKFFLNQ